MTSTSLPALRREVRVNAGPARAFAVFTEQIGAWWPLGDFSVFGAGSSVRFAEPGLGGRIVETPPATADGGAAAAPEESIWGTVTRWEPGAAVGFTWHPGRTADHASRVTVTFEADGAQTLVRLEHDGWEVFAEPEAAREEYGHGWVPVLDAFVARADAA